VQVKILALTDRAYGNVAQLKHLRTTVINQNFIQEEIKKNGILVMLAITRPEPFAFSCAVQKHQH
jgi:hypothetical protein